MSDIFHITGIQPLFWAIKWMQIGVKYNFNNFRSYYLNNDEDMSFADALKIATIRARSSESISLLYL